MESFEEHYASMCDAIKKHLPGADMALIDRAVDYANQKHKLQKRKDGSPYIIHPLAVAQIVAEMGLDCDAILGALLHDCIEDTDASHEDIEKIFGPTVAELVEGVTKLTRANFSSSEQAQMENLRKMFMAMSKDIRVVLIKIADRLHNMRTMQYQTPEKQIQKCRETMDVYAPLAHRLGMQKIKWELEDTALRYLAPMEYNEIMSYLQAHKEKDEAFMRTIQDKITQRLTSVGIHNTTYGRIKHVYSIYRKMLAQGKTIDELYDIYAFRVIVDTIPDCYNVLGHVHDLFSLVWTVQGLYLHPQAQHVPVPAHHRHRLSGHPLRGADPHMADARDRRIRYRRPLEVQAGHRYGYGEGLRVGAPSAGKPAGLRRRRIRPVHEDRHVRR